MKKSTLLSAFLFAATLGLSQPTFVVTAPPNSGATSSFRLPNGTSAAAYFQGASLVLASELTSIPVSSTLTTVGFTTTTGASSAVTGSINIYLQNTGDVTYNKGTSWSTISTGMTLVYSGTMTIPSGIASFDLPLTTPFTYLGSGMYIAYDWVSTGPFATSGAVWASNNTLAGGCVSATSSSATPTSFVSSSFRPCVRFGRPNTLTNDVSVENISSLGNIPTLLGGSHTIQAIVRNNSANTLNNVGVGLNVSGVNTFTNAQIVPNIGAGNTATVTFASYLPLAQGANTITVAVAPDQNNTNNTRVFNQMITCNTWGVGENPMTYTGSVGYGTGSGIIAARFQSPITATVSGANIAISTNSANTGNSVYAVLVDNTGSVVATSNTITISTLGTLQNFTFTPAVAITASTDYHIGLAQTANTTAYYPMGTYPAPYIPANLYNTTALTGGTLTPLTTNLGIMGIEAVFQGSCIGLGVNNVSASTDNNITIYPNPASTALSIKINSVTEHAFVTVYNALGQMVVEPTEIAKNSAEINVNNLPKGVYFLKTTNGKETSTSKFVVER